MKKTLLIAALFATSAAFAQTSNNGTTGSQATGGTSTTGAPASNAGANSASGSNAQLTLGEGAIQIIQQGTEARELTRQILDQQVSGTTTVKNTPSVSGPPLVSSNDTCMGSTSGSVNAPGIGVSLGTTWTDQNCKMLKNSRELWNMGMKAAALALMCTDSANREALELTGFKCPTRKQEKQVVQSDGERYTDPIVRSRLGLPPLN